MLNIRTIPDPEALIEFSRYLMNSIMEYQEGAQTLSAGQSNLMTSWEGDGATAYSETHSKMQQNGEKHMQQREQVANMLNAAVAPLGEAKIMQQNAIRLMEESRILAEYAAILAADPLTAPEAAAAEAKAAEMAAAAQEMEVAAQEIVAGIAARWQTTLAGLIESANPQKSKS